VSRGALFLGLALAAVDVVLVTWARPIFGPWWQHVMWEGGVVEILTALQFLLGGLVFAACALRGAHPRAYRAWFAVYAIAEFVLVGEETNYGRGTLVLNLADPNFAQHYNPQAGNLHNFLIEAYIPVLALGILCAALRLWYATLVPRLRLPMRKAFLDAVLVTAAGLPFTAFSFGDDRFLSVDEVYEWSSSFLLLCLALSFRFGRVFRADEAPDAVTSGSAPAA
jgi:hypothetical protein